jgi:hypothetical protein
MEKTITIHFGYLIGAITSFLIAFFTMTGHVQSYIYFAEVTNEMGFCMLVLVIGIILMFSSFSKPSKSK